MRSGRLARPDGHRTTGGDRVLGENRILFVPLPDRPAREAVPTISLKGKPTEDADCEHVASKCEGFSDADLKAVLDVALEAKRREAFRDNRWTLQ